MEILQPTISAVVFAYHSVGVRCLAVLLAKGINIRLVVTHEDAKNENIWFDSVTKLARQHDIPVIAPADPHDAETLALLKDAEPDFLFSFYYRKLLKPAILDLPKGGCYNMHGSLLPKYRGRVPINWAVLHGETQTGATLHRMVVEADAGDIVDQMAVPILPNDTAQEVFNKVLVAAELVLHRSLPLLIANDVNLKPVDLTQGSYFGGRTPEDGCIDWTRPAQDIHNLVRAVAYPYPGAFTDTIKGRLIIWQTLLHSESSPGEPALFMQANRLYARAGDGRLLRVLKADLNGHSLMSVSEPLCLL